jgi:hypothetical protein
MKTLAEILVIEAENCPDEQDVLLDYVLDQWCADGRPAFIILCMAGLYWPDRTFVIDDGETDGPGYTLDDAIDRDTGENAWELLKEECRQGRWPMVTMWLRNAIQMEVEREREAAASAN